MIPLPMDDPNRNPLVSILVWSDRRADMLAATLDSLLLQTYPATEIVVIDNASGDGSAEILESYSRRHPDRLRHLVQPERTSRTAGEYRAAHLLKGELVALASAGSRSAPERIAASVEQLLTTPNLGAICSRVAIEDAGGREVASPRLARINEGESILRRRLPDEGNVIDPDSCTLRARFLAGQPFNPGLSACGHLPLWLHIMDDSELLRAGDTWVTHRVPAGWREPEPSLAEAYETVAAIIAALRRWRLDQIFQLRSPAGSAARALEEAAAEAQLARRLMELDRRHFGRPALGCGEAYLRALAAVARSPNCLEAQQTLQMAYRALGDGERAEGRPSRPLAAWQESPAQAIPEMPAGSRDDAAARYRRWREKHALREIDGQYFGEHIVRLWQARPAFAVAELPGREAPPLAERLAEQLYPAAAHFRAASGRLDEMPMPRQADWLVLLPAGARLAATALLQLGEAINRRPGARLFYADDEEIPAGGGNAVPRFKPEPDPLLLMGHNYLGAVAVHWPSALAHAGDLPVDAALPYALALRLLARLSREALGHVPEMLFTLPAAPSAAGDFGALARHLAETAPQTRAAPGPAPGTFWLARPLARQPEASLILVATHAGPGAEALLADLAARTGYPLREILVCLAPGQAEPAIPGARCLRFAPQTPLGEVIDHAVGEARGEYVALVGAGNLPLNADWLDQALALAESGAYAAVGVAGLHPEAGHYWGAGIVVGLGGGFDLLHGTDARPGDAGHLGRVAVPHEMSAVSADGLLTRREAFVAAGGFDPRWELPDAMAVDYCLRLARLGGRVAWTPQAALLRRSPTAYVVEPPLEKQMAIRDRFLSLWLPSLAADPAWNRHLSLIAAEPEPEDDLVFRWNPDYRDRLRVLALPMPASGQAEYRVTAPLRCLDGAGMAQVVFACEPLPRRERAPTPCELERLAPDALYLQAAFDDVRFKGLLSCARFNPGVFRIFSLDDRVSDMPAYNASSRALPRDLVTRRMSEALRHCHRLVVSTAPLAELYRHEIDDIVIVPNRLEKARWSHLVPARNEGPRPRVGWAGALQHAGDLAMIREVVETLAGEVDWVFFGMIPAGCEPFITEFHATVHLDAYPAKLASLALDLAVAPLEVNLFNESKSNLRLLEYGIFGWPVICTDIDPYRTNDAPVCRVPNDARRWIAAIREHLADREALRVRGRELEAWVRKHYLLEDHLEDWLAALTPH